MGDALELLKISIACPRPPQIIRVPTGIVMRFDTHWMYYGDGRTLKIRIAPSGTLRTHDLSTNSVETIQETGGGDAVANFRDLDRSSIDVQSEEDEGPDGNQITSWQVVTKCSFGRGCVRRSHSYENYVTLYLCDKKTAEDAKVALSELIRLNNSYGPRR
jgi:hypothetical protein